MYVQAPDDRLAVKFDQVQIYWHEFERSHVGYIKRENILKWVEIE